MGQRILLLIPARFQSTRFPGKPLAQISGKSLIQRVYENCLSLGSGSDKKWELEVAVVTDSDAIAEHLAQIGANFCRVDDDVPSGSERIHLAYERFYAERKWDLIINVQGDEPLMDGKSLEQLASFHLSSPFDITTMVKPRSDKPAFHDFHIVKAIFSEKSQGRCLYFSRAPIPYHRDDDQDFQWFQHVGVYSYRPGALVAFCNYDVTEFEEVEKLEQLRALENGLTIGAVKTQKEFIGVDSVEDIAKVEGVLSE